MAIRFMERIEWGLGEPHSESLARPPSGQGRTTRAPRCGPCQGAHRWLRQPQLTPHHWHVPTTQVPPDTPIAHSARIGGGVTGTRLGLLPGSGCLLFQPSPPPPLGSVEVGHGQSMVISIISPRGGGERVVRGLAAGWQVRVVSLARRRLRVSALVNGSSWPGFGSFLSELVLVSRMGRAGRWGRMWSSRTYPFGGRLEAGGVELEWPCRQRYAGRRAPQESIRRPRRPQRSSPTSR